MVNQQKLAQARATIFVTLCECGTFAPRPGVVSQLRIIEW